MTGRAMVSTAANVLVTREDGRVLVVLHRKSGWWLLPGGTGEEGESPLACALREGEEELRAPVLVGPLVAVNWLTRASALTPELGALPGAYPCTLYTFAARIPAAWWDRLQVQEEELAGWQWVEPVAFAASGLMHGPNAAAMLAAVAAQTVGRVAYLEDGQEPVAPVT